MKYCRRRKLKAGSLNADLYKVGKFYFDETIWNLEIAGLPVTYQLFCEVVLFFWKLWYWTCWIPILNKAECNLRIPSFINFPGSRSALFLSKVASHHQSRIVLELHKNIMSRLLQWDCVFYYAPMTIKWPYFFIYLRNALELNHSVKKVSVHSQNWGSPIRLQPKMQWSSQIW